MILEVGKSYTMRNGVTTKLLEFGPVEGQFISDLRWVYTNEPSTSYVYSRDRPSPHDLISEA